MNTNTSAASPAAIPTRDLFAARDKAIELALEVGRMQVEQQGHVKALKTKAHANDVVSQVDVESERRIVEGIQQTWPEDGLLGEEGNTSAGTSGWRWVIDPLDGTRDYLTASGPWSVSIVLQYGETTAVGVVHDPAAGETFAAVRGSGATLNDRPIQVSEPARLAECLLGVSWDASPANKARMADIFATMLPVTGDFRHIPTALAISYFAAGRVDCAITIGVQPWDVAACTLIAQEAGARLGGVAGTPTHQLTVGSAPAVWDEYVAAVRPLFGDVSGR